MKRPEKSWIYCRSNAYTPNKGENIEKEPNKMNYEKVKRKTSYFSEIVKNILVETMEQVLKEKQIWTAVILNVSQTFDRVWHKGLEG